MPFNKICLFDIILFFNSYTISASNCMHNLPAHLRYNLFFKSFKLSCFGLSLPKMGSIRAPQDILKMFNPRIFQNFRLCIRWYVTALLCISQKPFFLTNWGGFLNMCLNSIKVSKRALLGGF